MSENMQKQLELDKNMMVQIRNDGITANQDAMTTQEARLLRLVIMQINKTDKELSDYEINIQELAEFLGINTTQTLYDDIYDICDRLTKKRIAVRTESTKNPWSFHPWMAEASYDGSVVKLALNQKIKDYVLNFHDLFTQYEMFNILELRSYYSIRIYEILKMKYTSCYKNKNKFDFSLEELRGMTGTEEKFKQIGIWKMRVIDIAEREINEKTDLLIQVKPIKRSRKYIGFRFIVNEKSKMKSIESVEMAVEKDKEQQIPGQIDYADTIKVLDLLAARNIPCTMDQAQQLLVAYDGQINGCFIDNLDYVAKNNRIKNRVAYLIKISNDHVAHEPDRPDQGSQQRKKSKTKVETIEPMSESREQAYRDLEVDFAEDLWPDLPVGEESSKETGSNLLEDYRNLTKKINEILKNPEISSRIGISSIDENMNKIDDMANELDKLANAIINLKKEINENV